MAVTEPTVQLSMTLRIQKLAIGRAVVPAEYLWDDVVAMPSSLARDWKTAHRALTALRSPQVERDSPPREGVGHMPAFAFLKVHLPCRVIWVRVAPNLGV